MTKKKLIFWACDYSEKTGEGNLARKFIEENFKKKKYKIQTLSSKNIFSYRYIVPFVGVLNCWKNYFKGHNVGYINYLPLWNFLLFFLLPPQIILGPITGGAIYGKSNKINYIIRKFIFPIFYKISEIIINLRFKEKFVFSTDLLKEFLSKKTIIKSEFNFVLKNLKFKKKKNKDIDFLIYYRIYNNKSLLLNYDLIKNLIKLNKKVYIVGDKLKMKGVYNFGYLTKKKLTSLQSRSKYSLCSSENIYSLFTIECITNHVKILINKQHMKKVNFFKKSFMTLNSSKVNLKKSKL